MSEEEEKDTKKPKHVKSVIAILIAVAASLMGGDALINYIDNSTNENNNNSGTIITDSNVDSIVDSIVNSTIDNSINTDIDEEGDDIAIDNSTTTNTSVISNEGDTVITSGSTLIETVADTSENLDTIKTDIRTMKMELGRLSNLMSKHTTSETDIAEATEEHMRIINANYHDLFSKINKVRSEVNQMENLQDKFDRIKRQRDHT